MYTKKSFLATVNGKMSRNEMKQISGGQSEAYSSCSTSCSDVTNVSSSCAGSCKSKDGVATWCEGSDGSTYNKHKCGTTSTID